MKVLKFLVLKSSGDPPTNGDCYLRPLEWNDWYKYQTLFELFFRDSAGKIVSVGTVKIASSGMDRTRDEASEQGYRRTELPENFEELGDRFFSLGQSENYYETLLGFSSEDRTSILRALRDIAFNPNLIEKYQALDVYSESVGREVDDSTVAGRFAQLAGGTAKLTPYSFQFVNNGSEHYTPYRIDFRASPNAVPPTNLHAIIGRNGVGKTHCLRTMAASATNSPESIGEFKSPGLSGRFPFRRVVSVSFSAFDSFMPSTDAAKETGAVAHEYIGLKRGGDESTLGRNTMDSNAIFESFVEGAKRCGQGVRRERWQSALTSLTADPVFAQTGIADIAQPHNDPADYEEWFQRLSSGHLLILLTVTRLVAATEERTLLLLDEPEAHLHPPLLSAFMRCLSDLVINRNAVAVVATHSPVVLQEVPRECAHIITRTGGQVEVHNPKFETFGESVARLTEEVFGLEVVESGFYQFVSETASKADTYEEALGKFDGNLGSVGRAILRLQYLGD